MKYEAKFQWIDKNEQQVEMKYNLPALVGPHEGKLLTENKLEPVVEVPAIVNAKKIKYCYLVSVSWNITVYCIKTCFTEASIGGTSAVSKEYE